MSGRKCASAHAQEEEEARATAGGNENQNQNENENEHEPLLAHLTSASSHSSLLPTPTPSYTPLTARHAFSILVTLQIGSGIFASPAQVDSNVPSPGASLLVWVLGGVLSWAGAASFAELGAAIPLNGGMQEYLRYVYGDTMAFLMAWVYIVAAKPSAMAIQSIVIAQSIGSIGTFASGVDAAWALKLIAAGAFIFIVLVNSVNTKVTMRLSESFTGMKIITVFLVVLGGLIAVTAYNIDPNSSFSGASDWHEKNWFSTRPTVSEGHIIDWPSMGAWERLGHYSSAVYGGLWAFDGWDNANVVASEIRNPGVALPRAIKAAMIIVLSSYELVNIAYYVLLPWGSISSNDAVAVNAARAVFGTWAGVLLTILVALSCVGSITGNVFTIGRLTIAASQRAYLPSFLGKRGLPTVGRPPPGPEASVSVLEAHSNTRSTFDAPIYANALALVITLIYIFLGNFRALLTFVGMAQWVFYVSTVLGLLVLRRREPELHRPFKPVVILPVVFVVTGTFIIIRTAMFSPIQSGVLAGLLVVGALIDKSRRR